MTTESPTQLAREIREALAGVVTALKAGTAPDAELFNTLNGSVAALQDLAEQATLPLSLDDLKVTAVQWEANAQRSNGTYRCILCNLPVSEAKAVWVLMSNEWEILPSAAEAEYPNNMGCHTVGVGCARKIPASHK